VIAGGVVLLFALDFRKFSHQVDLPNGLDAALWKSRHKGESFIACAKGAAVYDTPPSEPGALVRASGGFSPHSAIQIIDKRGPDFQVKVEQYPNNAFWVKATDVCTVTGELEREVGAYGPPSITDTHWTLLEKARLIHNQPLLDHLSGSRLWSRSVFPLQGSPCNTIQAPGDIVPGTLDWNKAGVQVVSVRCYVNNNPSEQPPGGPWPHVWIGQAQILEMTVADLKEERAKLLALGVSETPARSEPEIGHKWPH
jgi:hypothetical protein